AREPVEQRIDGADVEVLRQAHDVAVVGLCLAADAVDQDQRLALARLDDPGAVLLALHEADLRPEQLDIHRGDIPVPGRRVHRDAPGDVLRVGLRGHESSSGLARRQTATATAANPLPNTSSNDGDDRPGTPPVNQSQASCELRASSSEPRASWPVRTYPRHAGARSE